MRFSKINFVFALLAGAISVGSANAQQQVKFRLPVPVKWGKTMLQPGEYRMELPSSSLGPLTVAMTNSQKTVFALPLASGSAEPFPAKSYVQLVNIDGTFFVRKYASSATGRTVFFNVPKAHEQAETRDISTSN